MPLASAASHSYRLNLEPQKKNVFVTQLHDQPAEGKVICVAYWS